MAISARIVDGKRRMMMILNVLALENIKLDSEIQSFIKTRFCLIMKSEMIFFITSLVMAKTKHVLTRTQYFINR